MKRAILFFSFFLSLFSSSAIADPVVGQGVIFRYDSTHIYPAIITKIVSGTNVNLVALSAINSVWYTGGPDGSVVAAIPFGNVAMEEDTDYRWWPNENVPVEGPQGPQGATGASSNIASISTPSLTLNGGAVQFSSTNETIYTVSVSIGGTINLTTSFDGDISLLCDSNTTPSTVVGVVGNSSVGTVVVGLNETRTAKYTLSWRLQAGHRCRLTTTTNAGSPSYSIVSQRLQTLSL